MIPRQHLRLPIENTVFIEMESSSAGGTEGADIEICKTQDVSPNGMRVELKRKATVGAILHISVDTLGDDGTTQTFYLAAQVRWCKPSDDPAYPWSAGFELLNATDSDLGKWVALINQLQ